jgi:hypothetical protein
MYNGGMDAMDEVHYAHDSAKRKPSALYAHACLRCMRGVASLSHERYIDLGYKSLSIYLDYVLSRRGSGAQSDTVP